MNMDMDMSTDMDINMETAMEQGNSNEHVLYIQRFGCWIPPFSVRYQAQSDMVRQGNQTECQPMVVSVLDTTSRTSEDECKWCSVPNDLFS
jgi:hypothetical protein